MTVPIWVVDPTGNFNPFLGITGIYWLQVSTFSSNTAHDTLAAPSTVSLMNGTVQIIACHSAFNAFGFPPGNPAEYNDVYLLDKFPIDGTAALTITIFSHYEMSISASCRYKVRWIQDPNFTCRDDSLSSPTQELPVPSPSTPPLDLGVQSTTSPKPFGTNTQTFTISVDNRDTQPNKGVYIV